MDAHHPVSDARICAGVHRGRPGFLHPVPEGCDGKGASAQMDALAAQFDETLGAAPGRQAAAAQFGAVKPTVIAVMNETFTDLSIYDAVREAGYEGPQFYNSLEGTLQRGPLMVSVVGGGTANTEFEFLTGNSLAFIGVGKYPYQLYDLSDVDSLVKQMESMGCRTTAMHPVDPVNWKRSSVYEQLGFDEFLSIEDFAGALVYHSGATDVFTYDKIIELLERDAAPQFIIDVTMQNHSGYGEGTVPSEDAVQLDVAGVDDQRVLSELGVYLACINRSDEDLAYFIERLKGIDRPVALVFFGNPHRVFRAPLRTRCMGMPRRSIENSRSANRRTPYGQITRWRGRRPARLGQPTPPSLPLRRSTPWVRP